MFVSRVVFVKDMAQSIGYIRIEANPATSFCLLAVSARALELFALGVDLLEHTRHVISKSDSSDTFGSKSHISDTDTLPSTYSFENISLFLL